MPKQPTLHSYSDRAAFDRLMLSIATLVHQPGIGSRSDKTAPDQDALVSLQQHMQALAQTLAIDLPLPSVHTLRKDLATLRDYTLLDRQRHDWGYYLGTGVLKRDELQLALQALASQGQYQGDPQARSTYHQLRQRLKPLDLESRGELFYPVRAQFDQAIMPTDPAEMLAKRANRHTLFHHLPALETAIVQGQGIELYQRPNPYTGQSAYRQVYPLQLLYSDIAWYLVTEDVEDGFFAVSRVDRFSDYLKLLPLPARGLAAQQHSLQAAHQLLRNGWGLHLGDRAEQEAERRDTLELTLVKVRFFPPVLEFIREGGSRHPRQRLTLGPTDPHTGQPTHLDYSLKLPPRSLPEFNRWLNRYMGSVQVLMPPTLAEWQHQAACQLCDRYAPTAQICPVAPEVGQRPEPPCYR